MRFRILGPLEVRTDEGWSGIGAPKWRALLAMLLLHPGQVVSTDRLIAALWGEEPPDRAANLVSVYVLRLRRLIGDPQGGMLATRAPGYQLRLEADDLDAAVFESAVRQGRQALADGKAGQASTVLAEALSLWHGAAMADVPPSDLITAESDRLEESRLAALELRITADLRGGEPAPLVPELRRVLSEHPLREGLWTLLLLALEDTGRRAEAIAAYGDARRAIADELGVNPGPELRQLYQKLLAADADAAPGVRTGRVAPDPEPPRPARSLARVAAAAAAAPPPAQLPADIADFTGRASHLAQLRSLLTRSSGTDNPSALTVAVVAGTGGLGKTTLAVHAAHSLRNEFPDGQLYVSLRGAGEQPAMPEEVLARLLRDLGVMPAQVPAGQEERAALYRTRLAGRRVLIVLDDARDAAQVRPLLPGSASCAVIVTSRHRLADLASSRLVDLDVLDDEEARHLLTAIIGQERGDAEPGPVREVLAACAGLPLAIRIAGARLASRRGWTVSSLARRLADQRRRVDELTAGDMAVRACFDVSFDFLQKSATGDGVDPAHVFRLLGVWQGPAISLPAAAALVGQPEDPVADALEILVDAHLLESPAPDWYGFHDLLRVYASERAHAQERAETVDDAVARILNWYLRTADAAAAVIVPHRDRVPIGPAGPAGSALRFGLADEALSWSRRERANLVAATRQAAAVGLHDVAWKLSVAAVTGFERHGYRAEWSATHTVALSSARTTDDRYGEAWVLNNIAILLTTQEAEGAIAHFEQAMAIRLEIGDRHGQAQTATNLAFCYLLQGKLEEAVTAGKYALKLQRETGRRHSEGITLCNLGEAYLGLGRHEEAISTLQEALPVVSGTASMRTEAYVLQNLGRAHLDVGQSTEGADLLEQALLIHKAEEDALGQAQDLQLLGQARSQVGQRAAARAAWEQAAGLFEGLGDGKQASQALSRLAELGPSDHDS
ncbi:MAG TPA: BTAD domain-containing putative transcriptional regulator [Streptosporangiaceae bacterium]|nr:BTAD domain-containing putative transcriptional regulator [Streptosporangiaceae bacterium]